MKTIVITIDPKGNSRVETKGYQGDECREASRFVEQALGRRTSETLTAEYHQAQTAQNDLRQSS
jgi:hypothetical protein